MNLNELSTICHKASEKWWQDPTTGLRISRNKGELIALMHSELSECLEGERKDLMDDKLPHRKMAEVELVDTLIRIFDYAGAFGYDLQGHSLRRWLTMQSVKIINMKRVLKLVENNSDYASQ